ncbi:uncharacterized protein V6R79_019194 [Siganus canaliculatus]
MKEKKLRTDEFVSKSTVQVSLPKKKKNPAAFQKMKSSPCASPPCCQESEEGAASCDVQPKDSAHTEGLLPAAVSAGKSLALYSAVEKQYSMEEVATITTQK